MLRPLSSITFGGPRLRSIRLRRRLSQRAMAGALGISVSYLSQMESEDRPITSSVLDTLAARFPGEWASVDDRGEAALLVRALQAARDPLADEALVVDASTQRSLARNPALTRRLVSLHEAVLRSQEQLRALDDRMPEDGTSSDRLPLPWSEVRDWFHHHRNYVDRIDRAAEALAEVTGPGPPLARMKTWLRDRFGVEVSPGSQGAPELRSFDPISKSLFVDEAQPPETTAFSVAHLLFRLEHPDMVRGIAGSADLSDAARPLLAAGLANYAAGALLMPYGQFRAAALEVRHDIHRLRRLHGTSFEQTCHRLSTLQRPGARGIPFFFCRIDMAGNITKRHSATRLQFARFGGGCPLWIAHEAVAIPDRVLVQLAETPDGARYVSMAMGLVKASGSYARPPRRYAVALGCEVEHAADFIYADGLRTSAAATPIGVSCRICPRRDCVQRAYPPAGSEIRIDDDQRSQVPYDFEL